MSKQSVAIIGAEDHPMVARVTQVKSETVAATMADVAVAACTPVVAVTSALWVEVPQATTLEAEVTQITVVVAVVVAMAAIKTLTKATGLK